MSDESHEPSVKPVTEIPPADLLADGTTLKTALDKAETFLRGDAYEAPIEEEKVLYSTGSLSIDYLLQGGFAKGEIVEVYGREATGKTALALHIVANVQRSGGTAAWMDTSFKLGKALPLRLQVDLDLLALARDDAAEMVRDCLRIYAKTRDLVVVDDIASIQSPTKTPAEICEWLIEDLKPIVKESGSLILFLNQVRAKKHGRGYRSASGLNFKCGMTRRLELRRTQERGEKSSYLTWITARVARGFAAPIGEPEAVAPIGNAGFDYPNDIVHLAKKQKLLRRQNALWEIEGVPICGKIGTIAEDIELLLKVEKALLRNLFPLDVRES